MSRYNGNQGGSNGGSNGGDYEDDKSLKLDNYAALRLTPTDSTSYTHGEFGTSFIVNYEDAEVIDGVILQREDKPDTWKVFSAGKFFNLNPEDGQVYENYNAETEEYTGKMSAQDVLDAPRVSGYSTNAGGDDYYYTPVAVVIEAAGDIAVNDDLEVETTEEPAVDIGDASMLLSNKTWVRTYAKKLTEAGDEVINDNGMDPTPRGEDHDNPKYTSHDWLDVEDPSLRDEISGRSVELWVTEEENTWPDGETTSYDVPNVQDVKTGEFVKIDNETEGDNGNGSTEKAAADGGTVTESSSESTDTESTDSPDTTADDGELPEGVPDSLEDLLGYLSRNNDTISADQVREFAEDDVEDPDGVDWDAAADAAEAMDE